METEIAAEIFCVKCSHVLKEKVKYCPSCGQIQIQDEGTPFVRKYLFPVFLYYGLILILLAIVSLADLEILERTLFADVSFSGITLIFAFVYFSSIKQNLSVKGFKVTLALLVAIVSVLYAFMVSILIISIKDKIHVSDHGLSVYESLENYYYPLLLTLLTMALQPAIFEEIAFRGFLFNNLQKISNAFQAIIISSFMFGIIHLSLISLLWMIPLAIFYAFLRHRTGIIWYGVVGHLIHNSTVVLIELIQSKKIGF